MKDRPRRGRRAPDRGDCRRLPAARGLHRADRGDGVEALALARSRHPDLVVLDLGLPRLDGIDVARSLRKDGNVPIIMLTARVEESDRCSARARRRRLHQQAVQSARTGGARARGPSPRRRRRRHRRGLSAR
jgi:CheY-like chemotaxis protein